MVELLTLETEDGCLLDAAYWPATTTATGIADGCVFTHGATGNAFSAFQRAFGEDLSAAGIATISVNTRGHDIVSRLIRKGALPVPGGTAFEDLVEAAFDLHAAAAFLRGRGATRIAIGGHSLGAVKSIYVQAMRPVQGTACILAISPPRIAYEVQDAGDFRERFRATLAQARDLISQDKSNELIIATVPIPSYFAAGQYEKKYGPESHYDVARHLPNLGVPVFLLFGTSEIESMQQIRASSIVAADLARTNPKMAHYEVIEGADHSYTGLVPLATAQAVAWLGKGG